MELTATQPASTPKAEEQRGKSILYGGRASGKSDEHIATSQVTVDTSGNSVRTIFTGAHRTVIQHLSNKVMDELYRAMPIA
jgi:hypothetical protein